MEITLLGLLAMAVSLFVGLLISSKKRKRTEKVEITEVSIDITKHMDKYKIRKLFSNGTRRYLAKSTEWRTVPDYNRWLDEYFLMCNRSYVYIFDTIEEAKEVLDECISQPYDESYHKEKVVMNVSAKSREDYTTLTPQLMDAVREGNREKEVEILEKMEKLRNG